MTIGNGKSTYFRSDLRLRNSPFKVAFPRLFDLSLKKTGTEADLWNMDTANWDLGLRRNFMEDGIVAWTSYLVLSQS